MILKFEEYISEGLWSKGLERAQSGEVRKEDDVPDFFKQEDVYEIKGYPGYYISPRGKYDNWCVYVLPNEEPICEYENLYFDEDGTFDKGHEYWEDYEVSDDISDSDYKLMTNDDFIESIYHTLYDED